MASMTTVKCKSCKTEFQARTADVARGWGKFCSKSCKATKQKPYKRKPRADALDDLDYSVDQYHNDIPFGSEEAGW